MFVMLSVFACRARPEVVMEKLPERRDTAAAAAPISREELASLIDNFSRVHFESDSSQLDAAGTSALRANAEILGRHPEVRVEVEGHADERGTVDYNLALGQRRASTVVKLLSAYGVGTSRLEVVSLGEERPLVTGSGEVAWAENRRAEFRVLTGRAVGGTVR